VQNTGISKTQESPHVEITNKASAYQDLHIRGTFRFEFIPQGQTFNHSHCLEILTGLLEAVRMKLLELWLAN